MSPEFHFHSTLSPQGRISYPGLEDLPPILYLTLFLLLLIYFTPFSTDFFLSISNALFYCYLKGQSEHTPSLNLSPLHSRFSFSSMHSRFSRKRCIYIYRLLLILFSSSCSLPWYCVLSTIQPSHCWGEWLPGTERQSSFCQRRCRTNLATPEPSHRSRKSTLTQSTLYSFLPMLQLPQF